MVFKELEIQGFKSFPDKVKIRFDAGVTGVVGPNGSGKSNLSDAVRWVLGETSSRQLRAAGKMEDVIFGGTRRRGAMGFAQVRLTLDNADHTFDLDADEVTIGRKYYRSGESEYTINGQVCRLRDVYELLLDTGIGRDGYSVIGQGRIAEIVAAKSSERREIFEEACGIAKYRYRKTEAERRLAAAGGGSGQSGTPAGHPGRAGKPSGPAGKRKRESPEISGAECPAQDAGSDPLDRRRAPRPGDRAPAGAGLRDGAGRLRTL